MKEKEMPREYGPEEYFPFNKELKFADEDRLEKIEKEKNALIRFLNEQAQWGYNNSKVDCTGLSKGCRLCGAGEWSCLFINGRCNANCFYCPSPQNEEGQPTTQTIHFPLPEDYVDYLKKFGFKGVSISGGEPLLTFDRTIRFIKKIRDELGEGIYIWLYTNGILITEEKLEILNSSGLNEIRFDIGAVGYQTEKVAMARKIIDTVTIEIPAVPDEVDEMKRLMIHLDEIGIDHLNLHQIRCTSHNYKKLIKRGYFFFPGPQVTVPESELAALFLVKYAIENAFSYHVNYCSAIYKYRYQRMAARRRHAPYILQPWEEITETGMIRILSGEGETKTTRLLYEQLKEDRISEEDYDYVEKQNKIHFKSYLWNYFKNTGIEISVGYSRPFILPSLSYRNAFKEIELNARRSLVIERTPVLKERKLNDIEQELYEKLFIDADSTVNNYKMLKGAFNDMKNDAKYDAEIAFIVEVYNYERLGWGLLEYI